MSIDKTLETRGGVHGDWQSQAATAQRLKKALRADQSRLSPSVIEALDLICTKMSRMVHGDPSHPGFSDHAHDIMGYSRLIELELTQSRGDGGQILRETCR